MVISIQKHILPWEQKCALRSSASLLWDKLCPQHQPWANSFPRPCTTLAPGAHATPVPAPATLVPAPAWVHSWGSPGSPRKVPASDGEGSKWHRHTGLQPLSQGVMSTAESPGNWKNLNSSLNSQTSWREGKAARKSCERPFSALTSQLKWTLETTVISQEIQLWCLHRAITCMLFVNNPAPKHTALRKNQDPSNLTRLLQKKADWQYCICSYSTQATK